MQLDSLPSPSQPSPATGQQAEHSEPRHVQADASKGPEISASTPPSLKQETPSRSQGISQAAKVSKEALWPLKSIIWPPGSENRVLMVMQARNGPCSLIALCNVLILRNDITIYPPDRVSVSYEYLASLIADFIVTRMEDQPLDGLGEALQKLPDLQEGMDINSTWGSYSSFKQLGDGGELKLFGLCDVPLVHGWLADPSSTEYEALIRVGDYDSALNLIVAADDAMRGQLVQSETARSQPDHGPGEFAALQELTDFQRQQVADAMTIRHFLDANSSQLTYYGLFTLSSTLKPGFYALFRNSHLSVLYKSLSDNEPLYTLVTDAVFTREPDVVWETLEDVDGSASSFVNSSFMRSSTAGGDYSGATAEDALKATESAMRALDIQGDLELAHQLQAEEAAAAREERRRRKQLQRSSMATTPEEGGSRRPSPHHRASLPPEEPQSRQSLKSKRSKDRDCVIM